MIRVLCVDDEPSLLEICKIFLEKSGDLAVAGETSAETALIRLQAERFDAIVSDYQMLGMDGITFLKKIRSSGDKTPVIIFTGRGREEIVIQALNEGADFYLQKGGEPRSQFAELEHQIRQAVARTRAEEALRESETRFKTLFESTAEAQLLLDSTGSVVDCNGAFLQLFSILDKGEIVGHVPEEFAPAFQNDGIPSDERGNEVLHTVLEQGAARYEWAHFKHDPERTPILTELLCTRIMIAGKPMLHVAIRDITERKKAEEAIRERESYLNSIFRAAPAGIGVVVNRNIRDMNDRLCTITGYSRDELIGQSARMLYPTDEEFEFVGREKYRQIREYGTGSVETRWRKKDGSIIVVLLSSAAIDPENHEKGVTFTATDITGLCKTRKTLIRSDGHFGIEWNTPSVSPSSTM